MKPARFAFITSCAFAFTLFTAASAIAAISFCEQPEDIQADCDNVPVPIPVHATTTCANDLVPGDGDPTLVLYYSFDGDAGGAAIDSSAFGNNGRLVGTALKPGILGNAREFNGVNEWIDVPANPSINVGEKFTLAVWFKAYSLNTQQTVMYWTYPVSTGEAMAMQMAMNIDGYQWYGNPFGANFIDVNGNDVSHVLSTSRPSINAWHHFAVTYDNATGIARIYLDGNIVADRFIGHFIPSTKSDLWIGGSTLSYGPPVQWHGLLDEVRVYNRALSCFEIARLAQNIGGGYEIPVDFAETSSDTCPGTIKRVWTATDSCGSSAAITQTIAVADLPDSDSDGLLDVYETGTGSFVSQYNTGTSPFNKDTDYDGQNDGSEALGGSDPNNGGSVLWFADDSDFDQDSLADPAVYTPSTETAAIMPSSYAKSKSRSARSAGIYLPNIGGVPVTGDFDGDSRADVGVYSAAYGRWIVYRSSVGYKDVQFGFDGTIPVAGDYDGDGKTDYAVYHPASGWWYLQRSALGFRTFQWGHGYARPVVGDFDGDGRDDPGVYDVNTGWWYIMQSSGGIAAYQFGHQGLVPVAGDYDRDGRSDLAVYEPAAAKWTVAMSGGGYVNKAFGPRNSIPISADFDGDGRTDICSYNPRSGAWWIFRSRSGLARVVRFGTAYSSMPVGTTPHWP